MIDSLVDTALGDARGDYAVDLYAGVGLFTLPLAARFGRVDAVERGGSAFRDLEHNAGQNNIQCVKAATEDYLGRLQTKPDIIFADPPRSGLGPEATRAILSVAPERLTFVSCDPATLARDLKMLLPAYRISKLTLVDLFPQTYHFETVAHLGSQLRHLRSDGTIKGMSVYQERKEELERYEFMMGFERGRLAVTLDCITDAMVLVGQHGVYCQSARQIGKPAMDIQLITKSLTDAKELISSVLEELKSRLSQ